jgi:1,4-dihydroxy-6-naphthoate synthase
VETLNLRFRDGDFDATKASFAAVLDVLDDAVVLPVGAAVGYGVGPVVLCGPRGAQSSTILAPGEHTTATALWRIFHPDEGPLVQVEFSEIMPALERGDAKLGVCIHEGRFTYQQHGLELVEDLGQTWERATGLPLPLGGIIARRQLGAPTMDALTEAIRQSLAYARAQPDEALKTMRRHAQEESDDVLWKHVELYVTDETVSLSNEGRVALSELARRLGITADVSGV